jgi:RimJ/RimL family protein N-acetyltransferase
MEHFPKMLSRAETEAMVGRLHAHWAANGFGWWVVERRADGAFLGIAGLLRPSFESHFTPCVEIGWRLSAEAWGHGYATEAARASLRHGFEAVTPRLDEIVAFTVPGNVRSRRVMDRLGMRHDPADDFDHPKLPEGHPLRRHLLYRLSRAAWGAGRSGDRA